MRRSLSALALLALAGALLPVSALATTTESGTSRRIGASDDVVAAAVSLSAAAWDADEATIVVLGRKDVFADALAGAALAAMDGPVLYTATGALPAATKAEIQRVLPAPGGCGGVGEVVLLGGTSAISTAVEDEIDALGFCVTRIAGNSRVETAVKIAERIGEDRGAPSTVLLSRSDTWPDSATGSAYAARTGSPILVTSSSALDAPVNAFLNTTKPASIVLLGGTAALSAAVEMAAGAHGSVRRVAGTSRAGTAVAIAEQLWAPLSPTGVTLVNGTASNGWAYAIAGAVNAAKEGAAELFVEQASVPDVVHDYLDGTADRFSIIAGPTSLISDEVAAEVEGTRGVATPPGTAPLRYRDEVFTDIESTLGVVYGSAVNTSGVTETLLMDVFEPAGDTVTKRPTVMWIHGGGFYLGGTGEFERDTFYELVRRGYVVASISYRLIPAPGCSGGPIDVCIEGMTDAREDAQTALRFLKANAATYGIDATRIAVAGTSAGATTALHHGYQSSETPDAAPRAVVSIGGASYLGTIDAGDVSALIIVGGNDSAFTLDNVDTTIARATAAGLTILHTEVAGASHDVQVDAPTVVEEQMTRFLWWQLDLRGAAS